MKKTRMIGLSLSLSLGLVASYVPKAMAAYEQVKQPSMLQPIVDHVDVIAHRGASGYAPEHTLAAYEKAIKMKANYVELDLHMTKDGELIAIHDSTLARTTNVEEKYPDRAPWRVKDFTLAEIKKLDAGSWFNKTYPEYAKKQYVGEKIPTLQEVIDFIKKKGSKVALYIETKDPDVYPGMEEKLVEILKKNGYLKKDKVVFQSFSEASLRKLQEIVPKDIPLLQLYSPNMIQGKNLDDVFNRAAEYAEGVGPDKSLVTPAFMQEAHEHHMIVHPYTVNTKDEMVEQLSLGVDGMFTNYPDRLVELNKKAYISHGAASGEVTDTSAVLWARTSQPAMVRFEVSDDASFKKAIIKTEKAASKHDLTVQVKVTRLKPDTIYYYRVQALPGSNQVSGTFKTAPAKNELKPLTIVWGGDTGGQGNIPPFKAFSEMADLKPDFFLFSGDTIYADNATPAVPNPPSKNIEDFWAKYKENRTDPNLRKLLQSTSTYAIWDDHEVKNDFSGPFEPLTSTGFRAFTDYWPISDERSSSGKLYHKFSWGNTVDLFILNNRSYRDPDTKPDGMDKTMLGQEQLEWLKKELLNSDAQVKLIASSVPISIPTGKPNARDSWANGDNINPNDNTGYEHEFAKISKFIKENNIKNVNFVTADIHYADIIQYDPDHNGTVDYREFASGPIGAGTGQPTTLDPTFGPERLYAEGGFFNFGVIKVDPGLKQLTVEIRDENGKVHFHRDFPIE
ncbi:alkaline phosphatase D family protein [Bacillus methanolicus]|uniref:Glycerophosphoryl diester phosphodiesterase n=1 Tax=Bacillus methanolicus (strain MGA3 / ATCC 53907) TaxID=796606 RepID=I3E8A3_BACMM|nr:alkaline phosphatase D family protein [Bacillus methanolicus]AIE59998.1 glycerophosphoryl diester phosphodiesterase [Bacillus methanolicus MGA3]EIJ82724.1 glycerophosphoryl diester phosphodiesterase [Bacillus methanolicus MGA3]